MNSDDMTLNPISLAFDEQDALIVFARAALRDQRPGPRVGDFVLMPDGHMHRFTYDWGEDIQTTSKGFGEGSHYLCAGGGVSYSGALDEALPKDCLEEMPDPLMGNFWIFHHDLHTAHNGVTFSIPCRAYRYIPRP